MRALQELVVVSCLAQLLGCGGSGRRSDPAVSDLVIVSADARAGLEARYTEAGHTMVLRSRPLGSALRSELLDDDLSVGARAREVIEKESTFRTAGGQPVVAVTQRFADASRFSWALRAARHALRQLHQDLPKEMADGPHLAALDSETASVREALRRTRLLLLEEWASEARRQLRLTADEHTRFFDIFQHRARQLAAAGAGASSARREITPAVDLGDAIETLLGPERYQKYVALRKSWLAAHGGDGAEMAP